VMPLQRWGCRKLRSRREAPLPWKDLFHRFEAVELGAVGVNQRPAILITLRNVRTITVKSKAILWWRI
jgi:hypothetical protein